MKHAMLISPPTTSTKLTGGDETGEVVCILNRKEIHGIYAALSVGARLAGRTKIRTEEDGLPGVGASRKELLQLSIEFSHIPVW